jgi:hypothetical protein
MDKSEYDDTEMSSDEFEGRMAGSVPAGPGPSLVFVEASTNYGAVSNVVAVRVTMPLARVATADKVPA